jgi:hypothetical protein
VRLDPRARLCATTSGSRRRARALLGADTTRREIDWITRDVGQLFPEEWDRFRAAVNGAGRGGDLVEACSRRLNDPTSV